MTTKKKILWLITVLLLTTVFAGAVTMQASAAQTFTTTSGCKDMVNEGIEFKTPVAIVDPVTEDFRDRIEVEILNPSGVDYHTSGTDNVLSVALYAASDGTEYQCQQLTSDGIDNSFSCNSFPAGGTISSVHVTFIPNFSGGAVVTGDYKINITEIDTTDMLLTGTANIDATSTSCAQNQGTNTFSPPSGTKAFIYTTATGTCALTDPQEIKFVENTTNPFTIVSFPLGETIDPARLKLLVTPTTTAFNYTYVLTFEDAVGTILNMTYDYVAGDTADISNSTVGAGWAAATLPIKLTGGSLFISTAVPGLLPTQAEFNLTFYYQNVDPTLGYENSMFHFLRNMSVQFSNYCSNNVAYAVSSTSYDSCKSTSQSFSLSFLDSVTGAGMPVTGTQIASLIVNSDTRPASTDVYFMTRRCSDATCNTYSDSEGAYVSSVTVSDSWTTDTTYATTATSLNTLSKIPMYLFSNGIAHPFTFRKLTLVAAKAGTYVISAFKSTADSTMVDPLFLYITIPQYDSDLSCYTPGNDGEFAAAWDGCNEDFDTEQIEFKAVDEKYAFISNYSNQTMTFTLSPTDSNMPTTVEMSELYCEWQILADGYSSSGGSCGSQKIVVPPYTRAIVTGGKFYLYEKPKISDTELYLISYVREETGNDMTLIMDLTIDECKQEAIPDTGYSLRSPQKMEGASKSDIIFTGNSIQIPAIGLGMETPIPIVHVYYIDKAFENGWDLTMLGGYVGELEGGAYIPYSGNAVLTGHYYSQGVFVNLSGLHLEDEIIVYATDGMKYIYKVNNSFYTKPSDVYQLFQPNGEKSLTLVTCDSYNLISDEYENRYVVMAVLDHAEPYEQ